MTETPSRMRPTVPSWLISLAFHAGLLLILAATLRIAPRQGAASERSAEVGIVLKRQEGDEQLYERPEESSGSANTPSDNVTGGLSELLTSSSSDVPQAALPEALPIIGAGGLPDGAGVDSAAGAEVGPRGAPGDFGGKTRTTVFGIEGEGSKFAYVFDRSISMRTRNAIGAAKGQLIASLESLGSTDQFHIVFYNEEPQVFNPTGQPGRLFFATDRNKNLASRFVGGITPHGSTDHERALLAAIARQPDVIFFLTDADEPTLSPGQLAKIRDRAEGAGIVINAIEFGFGPRPGGGNFLSELARQNGGQYGYVDITRLNPVRDRP